MMQILSGSYEDVFNLCQAVKRERMRQRIIAQADQADIQLFFLQQTQRFACRTADNGDCNVRVLLCKVFEISKQNIFAQRSAGTDFQMPDAKPCRAPDFFFTKRQCLNRCCYMFVQQLSFCR